MFRSWFFLAWDEAYFDSDQAIVGLMAKHLTEGRAWPLFFYGQEYMLGVEAWAMAPVFLVLGPTVFALHLTMVLFNVAAALLLLAAAGSRGAAHAGGCGDGRAPVHARAGRAVRAPDRGTRR